MLKIGDKVIINEKNIGFNGYRHTLTFNKKMFNKEFKIAKFGSLSPAYGQQYYIEETNQYFIEEELIPVIKFKINKLIKEIKNEIK